MDAAAPTARAMSPPRGLAFPLAAVALLAGGLPTAWGQPDTPKLVVVVYPNESDGAPGVALVDRALRSTFAGEAPGRVEVRNEYVDTSRLRDAEFKDAQLSLLRRKYAGRKVALVVAGLSSGLDFVLAHRAAVFPGAPVVYVAVEEREVRERSLPPDVIGVPVRKELAGTLDHALRLHPDTRRVVVVSGAAPFDRYWEAEARRAFRPYEGRVEFEYLSGLDTDDLLGRVADLPARSVIYYLHVFQDGSGRTLVPSETLDRLAGRANAPIYGHIDTYVGRGAVGGRVFSFEAEGATAARLGLRLLTGEPPGSIPIPQASAATDLFDWRQLQRWWLADRDLPPGSVLRNKEETLWGRYRWHVVGGVGVCAVEAALIAGLIVQRVKRRRADDRFRRVVQTAPVGMLMASRDGTITMANAELEQLFGYGRGELLGRPVELLVPERLRPAHAASRDHFFAAPADRRVGAGEELTGRRKDGAEFPVEIGLSPLRTAQGVFVLASVADLTTRRRVEDELRASRRELQSLAGHLIEVQECERRRIARELHDDLSQGLALVAVELDLLAQHPPATATGVTERARDASARAKELAVAVHDLSHQLHPAKLEQLGLVAAVRGLCKELTQHHGLEVKFTHHGVPAAVPGPAALCLYRIAQEALRNVVKHARSAHARVELSGSSRGLRLVVGDDGIGFDPKTIPSTGGLGLVGMRERLHLVGGRITIDSQPAGGTRVDVSVPPTAPEAVGSDPPDPVWDRDPRPSPHPEGTR